MKKPDKKPRAKAETVGKPEMEEVLSQIREDMQHRIDMLSSISAKAADVLKFTLMELKSIREDADRFNNLKRASAVKVKSFDDAVDYIGDVIEDEASSEIEEDPTTSGKACYEPSEETDSDLVQFLFKESRFAIDPGEMRAYRRPELDCGRDRLAYEFVAVATTTNNESTFSYQESFIAFMYPEMRKTIDLFDEKVEGLKGIRFMTKEEDARNKAARKEAVEYYEKTEPVVRKLVGENKPIMSSLRKKDCSECRCHRKVENAVNFLESPPKLAGFKEWLLAHSRYAIPKTRFQILADRVDRKSQKYVYELRFFQKSYKNDETQSYERSVLRVRMNGDRDERILDRFDKAVSELRFNEFKEKKDVR